MSLLSSHPLRALRPLCLRLLLLAVLFSAAFGMPLHAAKHLQPPAAIEQGPAGDEQEGELETLCDWCASFAQTASVPVSQSTPWQALAAAGRPPLSGRVDESVAAEERWPYRSRDPPAA